MFRFKMAAVLECSDGELEIVGSHEKDSFSVFDEMRAFDELCDITLKVNEKEIRAHRVVLAACSPYFRAMLTSGFVESNMGTISLQDCEENGVEMVLDFIYSCKLKLNESNVESVLRAAALFQIHLVVQKCADFLETLIRIENCLGIQSLAVQYSLKNLGSKAKSFISWNFREVSRESEFVLIPASQLSTIVESDRLNVEMEEDVFEAVIRWYKHDREERIKQQVSCICGGSVVRGNEYSTLQTLILDSIKEALCLLQFIYVGCLQTRPRSHFISFIVAPHLCPFAPLNQDSGMTLEASDKCLWPNWCFIHHISHV